MLTGIANGNGAIPLHIYKNEESIVQASRSDANAVGPFPLGATHVVLSLKVDDIVTVRMPAKKGGFLSQIWNKFKSPTDVTITGWLVYENQGGGGDQSPFK